jgi:hypothetical protein
MESLYHNIRRPCKGPVAFNSPYIRPIGTNEVAVIVFAVKILILYVNFSNVLARFSLTASSNFTNTIHISTELKICINYDQPGEKET